eukprot:1746492-Rhodomonas_salina.1
MLLTDEQACLPSLALRQELGTSIAEYLQDIASPIQSVMVTSVRVDGGNVDCTAQRRALEWYSGAAATMETAVVFVEGGGSIINLKALNGKPGVVGVEPVRQSRDIIFDDNFNPNATPSPEAEAEKSNVALLITAITGAVCGVCLATCIGCIWSTTRNKRLHELDIDDTVIVKSAIDEDGEKALTAQHAKRASQES